MKINKHRRLTKIMQTLERWAPMETSEVTQHLSEIFGVPDSELKRNVLNDLKFLRDEGELTSLYFDKFGKLVSQEIEPEDLQYYRIKWDLKNDDISSVSGYKEIRNFQSHIMVSEPFKDSIKVRKGLGSNPQEFHYFYFELNHEIYHINLPKSPITQKDEPYLILSLTRTSSQYPETLKSDFKKLEALYPSIPLCLLSFNNPFISSIEDEAPITLFLQTNGLISIQSQKNKNLVEYLEIPEGKAKAMLKYLTFFKDKTQTQHWTKIQEKELEGFLTGDNENLKKPILLRVKENSGFILS